MGIITQEMRDAAHLKQRRVALENYYSNPNYCKFCGVMILVRAKQKASETKQRQFCSKSCAAKYNNRGVDRWQSKPSSTRTRDTSGLCETCGTVVEYSQIKDGRYYKKKYCDVCRPHPSTSKDLLKKSHEVRIKKYGLQDWSDINQMTKQEVLEKSGGHSWTMKCTITRYARKAYRKAGRPQICKACGYSEHINVCHIKDIKDFPTDALIGEINHIDNLVALCPNHHWEFDHGKLLL
jgi:hypothetical protein